MTLMTMPQILTQIIEILVGGIKGIATGIGQGLTALVQSIFLDTTTAEGVTTINGLSTFGSIIVVFAGISLAIGLSRWVVNWITSLGASH